MQLADKYEIGAIQLTNQEMKEKLIALFLCLRSLTGKPNRRNKLGEPLFSAMDLNDIAQVLRLHFLPWKGQKIDSVEKRIYAVNTTYKPEDPDLQELSKALQRFFLPASFTQSNGHQRRGESCPILKIFAVLASISTPPLLS
jgi:hypothetical protein